LIEAAISVGKKCWEAKWLSFLQKEIHLIHQKKN